MLLMRGVIPTWMELLKQNLSQESCGKVCAFGSTVNYLCTAFIPLFFGWILDKIDGSWRWIFLLTSLLGMTSIGFISKYVRHVRHRYDTHSKILEEFDVGKNQLLKHVGYSIVKPWIHAKQLLSTRPDFLQFQIGFFLGGAGLMAIHAILPKYFTEYLKLSYTGMFFAICFCKGIGFTLASPLWVRLFNRSEIFSFCARIPMLALIFPILLSFAPVNLSFLFLSYFLYGVMQAGSELGWKMSGPVFAKKDDSSIYSLINVLAVGVRGGIFPYLGAFLFIWGGPYLVFTVGGVSCLFGGLHLMGCRKKYALQNLSH